MIHYSCDRCRRMIASHEIRYELTIEVEAALAGSEQEGLEESDDAECNCHDWLEGVEPEELEELSRQLSQHKNYDLCSDCFEVYSRDPLGLEIKSSLDFSSN